MNTRIFIGSVALVVSVVLSVGNSSAKTAACPCHPCTCSPCTCGGGGASGKGGKHHDKEGHHDHGGGAGVEVGVDLNGVGQRRSEPDPFATGGSSNTQHTQETQKSKTKQPVVTTSDPFSDIHLTGPSAKAEAVADATKH